MQITLSQSIQIFLLLVLLAFLVYYVLSLLFERGYQPQAWKKAVKDGKVDARLRKAERSYTDKARFFNFWFQTERLKKDGVPGAFAELGVYKGDSARILHLMDPSRKFHLFDTFEGFREEDLQAETGKAATYTRHNFADTSLERVRQRLSEDRFVFHPGDFQQTKEEAAGEQFALVNMDVDLYLPTKAGLEFFYPRLSPGGVIIVHDYKPDWPGILKAVDEFAQTIPDPLVPLTDKDSSVMIFKSKK